MRPWWLDPELISAVSAAVIGLAGIFSGRMWGRSATRAEREQERSELARARRAAEAAAEQTTNNHGTNLRDDLTDVQSRVDLLLDAVAAESRARDSADARFSSKLDALSSTSQREHYELYKRVRELESMTSECSLKRLPRDPGV